MKILIPVEDQLFGTAIAHFLTHQTWSDDVEFKIVNVIEPFYTEEYSHINFATLIESSKDAYFDFAEQILGAVRTSIKKAIPDALVSTEVASGHVVERIASIARAWGADLIVVGSHGRSGLQRVFLGSVSLMLLSTASCPVLLIKPDSKTVDCFDKANEHAFGRSASCQSSKMGDMNDMKNCRIMIPVDTTIDARQIVSLVANHKWSSPQFKLLNVVKQPTWTMLLSHLPEFETLHQQYNEDAVKSGRASLEYMESKLKEHYPEAPIEQAIVHGDPKTAIVQTAKEWNADLIVLGNHGRHKMEKLLLGSVSLAVLCAAQCSVLLLRDIVKESEKKIDLLTKDEVQTKDVVAASVNSN